MANLNGTRKYPTFLDRLMAHTVILPWSGCYIYMGSITESGYGKITIKVDGKEKTIYVHRAAYEAYHGIRLPTGRENPLRHTCHVSCCWRPDHLIPGTAKQNVQDNIKRGTHANGWKLYHEKNRKEERRQQQHLKEISK